MVFYFYNKITMIFTFFAWNLFSKQVRKEVNKIPLKTFIHLHILIKFNMSKYLKH